MKEHIMNRPVFPSSSNHPLLPPLLPPPAAQRPHRHRAGATWPAAQLWLLPVPLDPAVCRRMGTALDSALAALPRSDLARLERLIAAGEPGAALRLAARRLHRRAAGAPGTTDLIASALLLAAMACGDDRAALEFAVMVCRHAWTGRRRVGPTGYPPPLHRPGALRRRMLRQAAWALAIAFERSGAGWRDALAAIGRMQPGDPLAAACAEENR